MNFWTWIQDKDNFAYNLVWKAAFIRPIFIDWVIEDLFLMMHT